MRVLPGDPLQAMAADDESGPTSYTEEQKQVILSSLGLDRPLYQQYLSWMVDIAKGDLGFSFWRDTPIRETIQRKGPITAEIGIFAVIISWTVGLPVGVVGAIWRNSVTDYLSRFTVTFFLAAPSFWLGLGFIVITVIFFTWRPPITLVHLWEDPWRNLQMTLPPAFAVGPGMAAIIARMSRATLLEVFREDYVRTARAKGGGSVEILLAFPGIILALMLLVALGSGVFTVIIAISIGGIAGSTRVIRSVVLSVKEMPYVDAARAIGASQLRVMLLHVAPQCIAPAMVVASASLGGAIFAEAALSFLGLGVPPPNPSWGNMLNSASNEFLNPLWWMVVFPGMAITFTILAFNLFGDALRDHLDPKLRGGLN